MATLTVAEKVERGPWNMVRSLKMPESHRGERLAAISDLSDKGDVRTHVEDESLWKTHPTNGHLRSNCFEIQYIGITS